MGSSMSSKGRTGGNPRKALQLPKSLQDANQDTHGTYPAQKGDRQGNHAARLSDRQIAIDQEGQGGGEYPSGEEQPESGVTSRPMRHVRSAKSAKITR